MNFSTKWILICFYWITSNTTYLSTALKDVRVLIPGAVKSGENALLVCDYDLEHDTLYAVKWYKGRREFYRNMPQAQPSMTVFPGIVSVERSMSNASVVQLTALKPSNSGRYSCEVSADAPSFHTEIATAALEVIDLPTQGPVISTVERSYSIGDILAANCSINTPRPLVTLTWLINNQTAHPQQINSLINVQDDLLQGATTLGLKLVLQPKHFRRRNLTLACTARIYDVYEQSTDQIIQLDATSNQMLAYDFKPLGSRSSQHYDEVDDDDEVEDEDNMLGTDIRMHHIRDPHAMSASRPCAAPHSVLVLLLPLLMLLLPSVLLAKGSHNVASNSAKFNLNNTSRTSSRRVMQLFAMPATHWQTIWAKRNSVQTSCRTSAGRGSSGSNS